MVKRPSEPGQIVRDGFASLESRFLDIQSLLVSPVLFSSPSRLEYLPYLLPALGTLCQAILTTS